MKRCVYVIAGLAIALPCAGAEALWVDLPNPDMGGVEKSELYDYGVMGPSATPLIVEAASRQITRPLADGPVKPTWESLKEYYRSPAWFDDAKFGIFMHWGLYSVPAHRSEWYEKHMYASFWDWHSENYGPPAEFGYKDFIPLFTADQWDPEDWAELFRNSGAKLVMPCAQHHDNFALWDSKVTPHNAMRLGPKRDLIGELGEAVRKRGMKYGVSNHGVENFSFIELSKSRFDLLLKEKADLFDPEWARFYNVADRSDAALATFLADWTDRNIELIDAYHPDILWFDNGVNLRVLDPLKLLVAAHFYNRALDHNQEASLSTKYIAFAPSNDDTEQIGSIIDFEKVGKRSPADIRSGPWMVDDPIGTSWGYTEGMSVANPGSILGRLIDTVSKGGFYLLNIAPKADGTIPDEQRQTLLAIGRWLEQNGEAIYGTRPWTQYGEEAPARGQPGFHFTTRGEVLYAIGSTWTEDPVEITSLPFSKKKVQKVELLGSDRTIKFKQNETGLAVSLPSRQPGEYAFVLRIRSAAQHGSPPIRH